jgi:hypothetical protein
VAAEDDFTMYTSDHIETIEGLQLSHGGLVLIALLSGSDFDVCTIQVHTTGDTT